MSEYKPIRLKRGTLIHATEDYRTTACALNCDGGLLQVDEVPNCKPCLRAMLRAMER